jgi:hypothetical protein
MPTYIIYPSSNDYRIQSQGATWNFAKGGIGTLTAASTSSTTGSIGAYEDAGDYYCNQVFQEYDTTSVLGTITAVSLSVNCSTALGTAQTYEAREFAWSGSTTSNFRNPSQLGALTAFGSASITGTGRFSIPKTVPTHTPSASYKLVLYAQRQRTDVTPTGTNTHSINMVDQPGTSSDPYLEIVTTSKPSFQSFWWG